MYQIVTYSDTNAITLNKKNNIVTFNVDEIISDGLKAFADAVGKDQAAVCTMSCTNNIRFDYSPLVLGWIYNSPALLKVTVNGVTTELECDKEELLSFLSELIECINEPWTA